MFADHKGFFPSVIPKKKGKIGKHSWCNFDGILNYNNIFLLIYCLEMLEHKWIAPDTYCPSISEENQQSRLCSKCEVPRVWTSKESFMRHHKFCHNKKFIESLV